MNIYITNQTESFFRPAFSCHLSISSGTIMHSAFEIRAQNFDQAKLEFSFLPELARMTSHRTAIMEK